MKKIISLLLVCVLFACKKESRMEQDTSPTIGYDVMFTATADEPVDKYILQYKADADTDWSTGAVVFPKLGQSVYNIPIDVPRGVTRNWRVVGVSAMGLGYPSDITRIKHE